MMQVIYKNKSIDWCSDKGIVDTKEKDFNNVATLKL